MSNPFIKYRNTNNLLDAFDVKDIYPDQEVPHNANVLDQVSDDDFREMLEMVAAGWGLATVSVLHGRSRSYLNNIKNSKSTTKREVARRDALNTALRYKLDMAHVYLTKKLAEANFDQINRYLQVHDPELRDKNQDKDQKSNVASWVKDAFNDITGGDNG